jgi:hypothetical protein
MISVVIPLYNKESLISNTIQTVLNQTLQDFEIVVINDGSTDNSVAEVKKINDSRIRLINQPNGGVSAARNRGIQEAHGEFIAFLDADDIWDTNFLQSVNDLAKKYPECDVFTTRYQFTDEFGNSSPSILRKINQNCSSCRLDNYFHIASNSDAPICSSCVMASRNALISIGGFPVGITSGEDLLTWAKLATKYKIALCNKILATYYTPSSGPTGKVPADLKSTHDAVGTQLCQLLAEYPESGIKEYVAFWYKMRSRINIGRRNRWATIKCACKSLQFNIKQIKPWVFMVLAISPNFIIKKVLG